MGMKLFDDGDSPAEDLSKIEIDREFAKRYEHNKKRVELQKFEELKKQGRVDSSSSDSEGSSSEEEEELIKPDKKSEFKFFDVLTKVKNHDPVLKNKDAKLFTSDSDSEDENSGDDVETGTKEEEEKKKKPMYLKDVVSKHLIEAGPEFDDEESDEGLNRAKTYSEEQDELRREFLEAVEGSEGEEEGDFLTVKDSGSTEDKEGEDDEIGGKLDEYFGEDGKLDEDTKFLKDYFRNRMWIDDGKGKDERDNSVEFSEDEEAIEMQEDYEREYNFRFEENTGDRILGHSRKVEGSVRKKENARKVQRERKEERIVQAELERKEELKRLKNLKKKEINEKLEKIREVAGMGKDGTFLDPDDLEDEFDPEDYDRKMKEAFGDGYYEAEDVDPQFGSDEDEDAEKPDFDKEDELLGLPKGWDDEVKESGEGFTSLREKILRDRADDGDENDNGGDTDQEPSASKRKRKRKPSEVEKAVREQLMEEYYKLDYEDTIGDLKTRFKYKTVKPKRYGLTPEEVMMMDDKELNQYVSLKKLVPYREKEWKVPRVKTLQLKQKPLKLQDDNAPVSNKADRMERHSGSKAAGKKMVNAVEAEGSKPDHESGGDNDAQSRRSKRRRQQAEHKLSRSRLMAYGKIPPKSKSKNQQ